MISLRKLDLPSVVSERRIAKLVVANNIFAFGTPDGTVIRWNSETSENDEVEIPKRSEVSIISSIVFAIFMLLPH
jgi:hypothetical protein